MTDTDIIREYVLTIDRWRSPVSHYREETVEVEGEKARVKKYVYTRGYYRMSWVGGYIFFKLTRPAEITVLEIYNRQTEKWEEVMVDDPMHTLGMYHLARHAYGDVIVAGLGLGIIIHYLAHNPRVKSITVMEKNPAVIKLIKPYINKYKVNIIQKDYFKHLAEAVLQAYQGSPPKKYDVCIADILTADEGTPPEERMVIGFKAKYIQAMSKLIANKVYQWGLANQDFNPAYQPKQNTLIW